MTSFLSRIGKPKALCRPHRPAIGPRGKFGSARASGIHAGLARSQTRPGRSSPREKVFERVTSANSWTFIVPEHHSSTQRSALAFLSISHIAPISHARHPQTDRKTPVAAYPKVADSAKARITAFRASKRRSADLRSL